MTKKTIYTCGNSQMVASHLTKGPSTTIGMEEATFHDIPTDVIFPRQWILVLSFCYISRGNGKTQANCCIACALRPQIRHKETEEIRQNPEVGKTKPQSLVLSRECPIFAKSQIGNIVVKVPIQTQDQVKIKIELQKLSCSKMRREWRAHFRSSRSYQLKSFKIKKFHCPVRRT